MINSIVILSNLESSFGARLILATYKAFQKSALIFCT